MHGRNKTNRKHPDGRAFRLVFALLAAIELLATISGKAQTPGAVFSNPAFYLGPSSSSGINQDYQANVVRIAANQRGDVFFTNINFSGLPDQIVMVPAGTYTQVLVISNLLDNSDVVTTDPQGNLWTMNGNSQLMFIPVTAGVYPTGLNAQNVTTSCTLPVAGNNSAPCLINLNGNSTLGTPAISDLQIDASGKIYALEFSDYQAGYNHVDRILKFNSATMVPTVVLDNLPAARQLGRLAVSTNGDLFVADGTNVYYSAAGSGTSSTLTGFVKPTGISSDSGGNIYVTQTNSSSLGSIIVLPVIAGVVTPSSRYPIVYSTSAPAYSAGIDGFGSIIFPGGGYGGTINRSSSATVAFGSVVMGSSTTSIVSPIYFTKATTFGSFSIVSNSGSSIPFNITTSTCTAGNAYAVNATCNVLVRYNATAIGPQAGTLFVYDNSSNLIGTAYLSGVGLAPVFNVDPGTGSYIGSGWHSPSAITVDAAGNNYVADSSTGSIYKNGSATALVSGFNTPSSIVVDSVGNLYIADSGNNRVVEVPYASSTYGTPITVFTGTSGRAGLAIDSLNNLYLADSGNSRVMFLGMAANLPAGSNPSPIGSGFTTPVAVATDSVGNVYISDSGTGKISQFNFARGTVVTIASGLTTAAGVAVDPGGNLFYADSGARTITRIPSRGGTLSAATASTLSTVVMIPSAIAVDATGNVYMADSADATVGKLTRTSGTGTTAKALAVFVKGQAASFVPATVSGGSGTLSYAIYPALPSGLSFASATGTISGTPTAGSAAAPYTVTVTDANGSLATANFSIAVDAITATTAVPSTVLTKGHASPSFVPVTATGGMGALTYAVSPALPAGLNYAASTGTVSGTPTAVSAAASYTVTVSDANGASSTASFSLAVNAAVVATTAVASTVAMTGQAVSFVPVTGSGGTGTLSYALSPTLPAGLSISSTTGTVSGTPTAASAASSYTVTVTDANAATATANFSLEIDSTAPTITFNVANQTYGAAPFTVAATSNSSGAFTYSVISGLASVSGSTVTLTGSGTVVLQASQAASGNYAAGTQNATFTASTGITSAHFSGQASVVGGGFSQPQEVAVDRNGNVFVADAANNAVKEIVAVNGAVSATSTIITVSGGFSYPNGVAVDGAGNVFVADSGNNAVKEIVAVNRVISSTSTINVISSSFNGPSGVAVDSGGDVFVADRYHQAVKEVMAVNGAVSSTSTINTVASGFVDPTNVAVDSAGNVFVADHGSGAGGGGVKEIVAVNGVVSSTSAVITVGSGFNNPHTVAVDSAGDVFFANYGDGTLKEILAVNGSVSSSSIVETFSGTYTHPTGLAVDGAGHLFVAAADYSNNRVVEINLGPTDLGGVAVGSASTTSTVNFLFDIGGTIAAPKVLTKGAAGLDFTDAGTGSCTTNGTAHTYSAGDSCTVNVIFTPRYPGQRLGAVQLVTGAGALVASEPITGMGTGPLVTFSPGTVSTVGSGFDSPSGVAVDGAGNVFVADRGSGGVKEIIAINGVVSSGSMVNVVGSGLTPVGLAVDGAGNVFVADNNSGTVKKILAANGTVSSGSTVITVGSGFSGPVGLALDKAGNVFVADRYNNKVYEIVAVNGTVSSSSTVITLVSGLNSPYGVAVDSAGNVFVADRFNNLVKEIVAVNGAVSPGSTVITVGSGFSSPYGLAVDALGNVFVGDHQHNAVKEIVAVNGVVSSSSTVNTVASGMGNPAEIALDGAGNIFTANYISSTVTKIDLADAPSLSFASTVIGSTSSDSPQTVTITNSGNAPLTFPPPTTGTNPSIATNFLFGNSSTCPQLSTNSSAFTVASGASCTDVISFAPTTLGSITGSLVMTDNHLNASSPYATQSIALSGTGVGVAPTITFNVANQTYGAAPFTVAATSNSSGAFTYSVVSGPATISGATVTLTGAGTVVLQASQAANGNYAGGTRNASFTVTGIAPTITFTVANQTYGAAPFTVAATSNSAGALTYSVVSGPATISGSTVTLTGAGTVVLQASQAASGNYAAGTQNASFTASTGITSAHFSGQVSVVGGGFSVPAGAAVDSNGNVFVADTGNNSVKEILAIRGVVSATSTIVTVGNGFSGPTGVAVDSAGNVFVADYNNNVVKEIVAVSGVVSSSSTINIIGSGFSGPYAVAVDHAGDVFVADRSHQLVKEIVAANGTVSSSSTVNIVGSGIGDPTAVAVDSVGNVFVSDANGGSAGVKEIVAVSGGVSSSSTVMIVGSGFSNPDGVAVDGAGNVFFANYSGGVAKEILAVNGTVSASSTVQTLGGVYNHPTSVVVDGAGHLFVAERDNNRVVEINLGPTDLGGVAVGSASTTSTVNFLFDIGGTIAAPKVLTKGAAGLDFTDAGTGSCTTNGTAHTYSAGDSCTVDVIFTPRYPGQRLGAVQLVTPAGAPVATEPLTGTGIGPLVTFSPGTVSTIGNGFSNPSQIALDGAGNVYVADLGSHAVKQIVAVNGVVSSSSTVITVGSGFNLPSGVAVDGAGNVFVADYNDNVVKEILAVSGAISSGSTVITVGSGFNTPRGVAVDSSGNVFVADAGNNTVKQIMAVNGAISSNSTVITVGSGFYSPNGVAVDKAGNVFVADSLHGAIKEIVAVNGAVSFNSTVTTIVGSGLNDPVAVTLDAAGNVFFCDYGNNAVKEIVAVNGVVSSSSTVKTIGNLTGGPQGVALDETGNLLTSKYGSPLTKIDRADAPSLSFTFTPFGSTSSDSPQTVTLTNSGNAPLTFPPPITGLNPSISPNFLLANSSTCPQLSTNSTAATLAPGASCTEVISFAPTTTGPITGTLTTTDNNLNAVSPLYASQSVSLSGTGVATAPTITFNVANQTYGAAPFTVTATSNSSGAFTYSVLSGPATISGATVTLTGAGTVVLQASQAANGNYTASTKNATFTVAAGAPTITFTVANQTYGAAPFTVTAASNSSGALTYSVVSGPATISGATVTLTGTGTVVLQAAQAANGNYTAATQNATFTVAAAPPTISFTVANQTYPSAPFTVAATSNSAGAFTYSVVSGPATISGATVTLTASGTVVLQAAQAASGNFAASTQNASFTVLPGLFLSVSPTPGSYTSTQTVTFSVGHSGATIYYTLDGTSPTTSSSVYSGPISVSVTTPLRAYAVQSGYSTSSVQIANYNIGPIPTIDFGNGFTSGTNLTLNGASLTSNVLRVTDGNYYESNSVYWTAPVAVENFSTDFWLRDTGTAPLADGLIFTLQNSGVNARTYCCQYLGYGGISNSIAIKFDLYDHGGGEGTDSTGLYVNGALPNLPSSDLTSSGVILGSGHPIHVHLAYDGTTLTLTLTDPSVPATFTQSFAIDIPGTIGSNVAYAGFTGSTGGSTAFQDILYWTYTSPPIISFSVANKTYGAAPFTVAASSSSPAPFTYSVVSGPATISGSTVTLTGTGTVVLQAAQAGNMNYLAGTQNATFTVAAASPTITFNVANQTYGAAPFTLAATSNSAGAFTYSVISGPATISGATVTLTGTGSVVLRASQAANGNYTAKTKNATFTVAAAAPTITFSVANKPFSAAPFTVAATSNSAGVFTYSVISGPATLSGSTVTLTGTGAVVLQASQAANGNYTAGIQTASFTVSADSTQTVVATPPGEVPAGLSVTLTAAVTDTSVGSTTPTGVVTFTDTWNGITNQLNGGNAVPLSGGTASITTALSGGGTHTITANFAGTNGNFVSSTGTVAYTVIGPSVYGIFTDGNSSSYSGVGGGYAYSSQLLGTSITVNGSVIPLGPPDVPDAYSANGSGTISIPGGNYSVLNVLAIGVYGNQELQAFTITYADGTTTVSTQSLSDWCFPMGYAGETVAVTMPYRDRSDGTKQYISCSLYAYSFAVDSTKVVTKFTLPANNKVLVFGVQGSPNLVFAPVSNQTYGSTPFTVSASSSSLGAVTYAVVSGPATISGSTVTLTGVGSVVLSATQAASGNYGAATKTTSFTVSPASTSLALQASSTTLTYGQQLTLIATLSPSQIGSTSTEGETITFKDGATTLGTGTLSAGVATFNTSSSAVGSHTLTASFAGDSSYASAISPSSIVAITRAAVSVTVTISPNPSIYGDSVSIAVAIGGSSSVPTGTGTLMDGATTLATLTLDGSGTASYTTRALAAATHTFHFVYNGDSNYQ